MTLIVVAAGALGIVFAGGVTSGWPPPLRLAQPYRIRANDSVVIDSSTDIISATESEPIDVRVSGRYIGLTLSGNSLGCYVRLGFPVAFIRRLGDRS